MALISPKNETAGTLRLYFIASSLLLLINLAMTGFTTSFMYQNLYSDWIALVVSITAISYLYFGLALTQYLAPAKVKIIKAWLVISFFLVAEANLAEMDYVSLIITALIVWYLFSAVSRLSKAI